MHANNLGMSNGTAQFNCNVVDHLPVMRGNRLAKVVGARVSRVVTLAKGGG